ncbi:MAG TPA: hypothetical protein VN520_15630 [Streptomyces sp.]|uniref:hypothetical protein n=1 Tax=Streptomyces sp. TaxID=1931 RepID=UPI002CD8A5ED|nr:hypothetical protein [Streptomyces sp.]HWU07790.1 hypothetical protein [Streptomyces sp.]
MATYAEGGPASALWDASVAVETAGVRVVPVSSVSRLEGPGEVCRAEAALMARLGTLPGRSAVEELEEEKLLWLDRAGIAREAGADRAAAVVVGAVPGRG